MREAEDLARNLWHEGVTYGHRNLTTVPPDAGSIQQVREKVMDAAHLHDDLLTEVLTLLERDGDCAKAAEDGDGIPCEFEMVEQGQACWYCMATYRLRCAGVESVIS